MSAQPTASLPLGIVVERRAATSPWQDEVWRPVAVIPRSSDRAWRLLEEGPGWARFYAGSLTLELYRRETEGYRRNLSAPVPLVYVVLRPGESGSAAVVPFLVTACPYEASAYQISGDEVVEGVPMPDEVGTLVQTFVDLWHVDQPFIKRKQKPKVEDHGRGR